MRAEVLPIVRDTELGCINTIFALLARSYHNSNSNAEGVARVVQLGYITLYYVHLIVMQALPGFKHLAKVPIPSYT